jgi:hypothetical protein
MVVILLPLFRNKINNEKLSFMAERAKDQKIKNLNEEFRISQTS